MVNPQKKQTDKEGYKSNTTNLHFKKYDSAMKILQINCLFFHASVISGQPAESSKKTHINIHEDFNNSLGNN